jgi:uncharacterized membrane protein YphA (DoxX/SURF4 family)
MACRAAGSGFGLLDRWPDEALRLQCGDRRKGHFGLHPGWLWAALAIIIELGGSALVMLGRLVWLGAGGLGVLTAVAMLTANDFWHLTGHDRFMALNAFFEHVGLIAGLVIVSIHAAEGEGT